jgi:hypothetical protein
VERRVTGDGDWEGGGALASGEMERGGTGTTEGDAEAGAAPEADADVTTLDAGTDVGAVVFAKFDVFDLGGDECAGTEGLLHRVADR